MEIADGSSSLVANDVQSESSSTSRASKKGKSKKWIHYILPAAEELPQDDDEHSDDLYPEATLLFPPGSTLNFFPQDMYTAPTELVYVTRGVLEFMAEFNQLGPNKTKTKLFFCSMFRKTGQCSNGFYCREVHPAMLPPPANSAMVELDPSVTCNTVHSRSAPRTAYPRLPTGVVFHLSLPNMQSPLDDVPSEVVFLTKGAKDYYDQVMRNESPHVNMQHCAHFSKNGMCCFGQECQFVHVSNYTDLHPPAGKSTFSTDDDDSATDSKSSRSSSSTSKQKMSKLKKGSKETPLSLEALDGAGGLPPGAQIAPGMMSANHIAMASSQQARNNYISAQGGAPMYGGGQPFQALQHHHQHLQPLQRQQVVQQQASPQSYQHLRYPPNEYNTISSHHQQLIHQTQLLQGNQQQQLFVASQTQSHQQQQQPLWAPQGQVASTGQQQQQPQQQYYFVIQQPSQQQAGAQGVASLYPQQFGQQPQMVIMPQQQGNNLQQQQQGQQQQFFISQPSSIQPQGQQTGAVGQPVASAAGNNMQHLQHPFFQGLPNN